MAISKALRAAAAAAAATTTATATANATSIVVPSTSPAIITAVDDTAVDTPKATYDSTSSTEENSSRSSSKAVSFSFQEMSMVSINSSEYGPLPEEIPLNLGEMDEGGEDELIVDLVNDKIESRKPVEPLALIITAPRDAAKELWMDCMRLCYGGPLKTAVVYSKAKNPDRQIKTVRRRGHILISTPTRLMDYFKANQVTLRRVRLKEEVTVTKMMVLKTNEENTWSSLLETQL